MIPLLIRWTLGCNYQSWWEEDEETGESSLSFSLSRPFVLLLSAVSSGLSLNVGMELIVIRRRDRSTGTPSAPGSVLSLSSNENPWHTHGDPLFD